MEKLTVTDLQRAFPQFISRVIGSPNVAVSRISTADEANAESLVYITNPKFVTAALASAAPVILSSEKILGSAQIENPSKTFILSPNPELALAFMARKFFSRDLRKSVWWSPLIHPSAVIAPSARLGERVIVAPHAVIGPECVIGDDAFIGANVVLEEQVKIGRGTTLHPHVFVAHNCEIGEECDILPNTTIGSDGYGYAHDQKGAHYRIPQMGRVIIEDRVDIGAGCAVDRGALPETRIGEGTKMDNLCHVAHNTRIGKHCLITAMFIAGGSAQIGNHVIIGGRTSVVGHKKVGDFVHIAAHSAIANDLLEKGEYGGYPVQPVRDYLKTTASLAHLPEMRKQIYRLLKQVFGEGESNGNPNSGPV